MRFSRTVFIVVVFILFFALDDGEAARGRSSGGSRSKIRSKSKSKNSRSSGGSSSSGSSGSKPKITKYTPIKATTIRSPVITRQTKLGSRSDTFTKVLMGYMVFRYTFAAAPVYRRGYPMYGSYVSIPEKRAVRVIYEEQKLLNAKGELCLNQSSANQTLREGINDNLVELNTTVKYEDGEMQSYYGINSTISLEDIKEENFEVISRARYNTTIVEETSCAQVESKISGTMIEMYETNPNIADHLRLSNNLLYFIVIVLIVAIF